MDESVLECMRTHALHEMVSRYREKFHVSRLQNKRPKPLTEVLLVSKVAASLAGPIKVPHGQGKSGPRSNRGKGRSTLAPSLPRRSACASPQPPSVSNRDVTAQVLKSPLERHTSRYPHHPTRFDSSHQDEAHHAQPLHRRTRFGSHRGGDAV